MSPAGDEAFDIDAAVTEGGKRLGHRHVDLRFELCRVVYALHAAATATSNRFDEQGVAGDGRPFAGLFTRGRFTAGYYW